MQLPFFFHESDFNVDMTITLTEEGSRHVVQVLRMQVGEMLKLTNGKGSVATASIADAHKKHCLVQIKSIDFIDKPVRQNTIGISLLKNNSRFEWFLEKATELGTSTIIPLICDRTEKQHFRLDRMRGILISAMLQSQQAWLPEMNEPVSVSNFLNQQHVGNLFIAHCLDDAAKKMLQPTQPDSAAIVLIGPEGDFSTAEIQLAIEKGFQPVSLGSKRLRTETAGVYAAVVMNYE